MKKEPRITKEDLYQAYVVEGKTPTEIARNLGIHAPGIYEYLQRYNIPIRSRPQVTKEQLYQWYIEEKKTQDEIAILVGLSTTQISYWLRKYGIKTKTLSDYAVTVDREWILQQHNKLDKSWKEIREELGLPSNSFFNMLARLQIPLDKDTGSDTRVIRMNYREQSDKFTPNQRKQIIARDMHKCQMPGCRSKADKQLEVHHIISVYNNGPTEENNAITLCHSCHVAIKGIEDQYITLFQEIVKHNKQEAIGSISVKTLNDTLDVVQDNTEGSLD